VKASILVGATLLLGCAVLAAVPASMGPQDAARTERPGDRYMFVTVLDKNRAPVSGLMPADFVVREDGVAREVLRVERATGPITLALLVDNTQTATPFIADMRTALHSFVKRMGGANPITFTTFGDRPTIVVDYSLDVPSLMKGVDRLFAVPGSGSTVMEAVREICKGLAKRDFDRGVILTITGGGAEFSERHYTDVLPAVRDSGAAFVAMTIATAGSTNLSDNGQRNRALLLDEAARATGGVRVELLSSMALDHALTAFGDELSNQYRVTYAHPEALIPPSRIEVSVRHPGLTARGTPVKTKRG
jgi:Ca-activated chloride channel family protein